MAFFEQAEKRALEREARIREREMEMEVRFREMEDRREERMLSFFASLMGRSPATPPSLYYDPQQQSISSLSQYFHHTDDSN